MKWICCCVEDNDLYGLLPAESRQRADSIQEALSFAEASDGLLILADTYPDAPVVVRSQDWEAISAKGIRVFGEFLGEPGCEIRESGHRRLVVASDFFGKGLSAGRILSIHDCRCVIMPYKAPPPSHLVLGKVAGFERAMFGLPVDSWPVLYGEPAGGRLLAATKLSHFVTGRYAPVEAWRALWQRILHWLCPGLPVPALLWTPSVNAAYGREELLAADCEEKALQRAARWHIRSRLLVHSSRTRTLAGLVADGKEVCRAPSPSEPLGNGRLGILEGYAANIQADGSQPRRLPVRCDCNSESAMALAFAAATESLPGTGVMAANLLDFVCFDSRIQQAERADPEHPAFGLMAWGVTTPAWEKATYGDDNARAILAILAAGALLGSRRWDEGVAKALLANLRTTGIHGFRGNRIDIDELARHGWRHYHERDIINPAPHYESYLWACYLLAWRLSGLDLFVQRAREAIRATMDAYPDGWRWTNGFLQEQARMLLCLSWLVRVEDTGQTRAWLARIADDLLAQQESCGALRERLGPPGTGKYPPLASNEEYGSREAPLIQEDGDPVCDLLYTSNFAFLGLHEAAAATNDARLRAAENKLAEFLCRIQVRSDAHPYLDGGWFRAFDYSRWEFWGSSADLGWGAWCIEAGWTMGWIPAVFAMRRLGLSLWDLAGRSRAGEHIPRLAGLMGLA